ncbi:MAG: protein kinase [Kofleriaceae bacterium]
MELTSPATQMWDLFAPGTMLGRNELLATIGEGGMARVILARQRGPMGFEKVVVVKVIHPRLSDDAAAIGMLLDEARVAAQLAHPNVVHTYELGEAHGTFYIVMEYLAGESLQRILKTASLGAGIDPRMTARVLADAAAGLHAAHELTDMQGRNMGLIHRDVSLGNIIVLYNGSVKVVDFGIAKTHDRVTSTTAQGQLKGKYAYMSPEQIRNEPMDRRSDVFSLGVVLWECLALRRLFHSDNVPATLLQIVSGERVPPSVYRPEIPAALDAICMNALAIDPAQRFQSAQEMQRALEDTIWQSRCDSSDVQMYMTAVFGDRIRKRQALLASCNTQYAVELEPRDATFDDTSGLRTPGIVPPPQLPPLAKSLYREPTAPPVAARKSSSKRLLGWLLGIAVMFAGGAFAMNALLADRDAVPVPLPTAAPIAIAIAQPRPAPPVHAPVVVADAADEIVRSNLRPEHLEPVRYVEPVAAGSATPTPPVAPVRNPAAVKEHYTRGMEQYLAGNFAQAEQAYKQALALDHGYAPAHRGLGFIYQRMGFTVKAIDELRRYLNLVPNAPDAATVKQRIEQLGGTP